MEVSIVVATWQNSEITKMCYESLFREMSSVMELVWVDNGSDDGHFSKVYDYVRKSGRRGQTIVIRNRQNMGYVQANNQGIRASSGGIVVLLNNDTVLYEGSMFRLLSHMSDLDMVIPVTNNSCSSRPSAIRTKVPDFPDIPSEDYERYHGMLKQKYDGQHIRHGFVPFFCVAIKRQVFEKVGMLDERFKYGYAEDRDYCYRASDSGVKIGIALDTFVYHAVAKTFSILNSTGKINMKKYWNEVQDILVRKHTNRKVYTKKI